jgi:protein ImuB
MPLGRIACLSVPLFPLAARLRSEPELGQEALAILAGNGHAARVVGATRIARRAGVKIGMTLPQARALVPKLVARPRDPECEVAAQEALFEVAETFSPRVEDAGEGLVYLDVDGIELRFPAADLGAAERIAAEALARTAERSAGLPARVGVAGSKLAARTAAEQPGGAVVTVIPPGEEPAFLAPLPLARLAPELRLAETLARWGLTSVGDFARLPEAEVASRLGRAGHELQQIARGHDPRPLVPREPPPTFREGLDLEWPLVALEPFLFIARAALDRLGQRLAARGLGCARLAVDLRLEPDGFDSRSITLPAPTVDAKALTTLLRLELEARQPGAAVVGFAFTAHPNAPRAGQLSLLGPEALAPDRLGTTLARLFALLGPERVGSPRPKDGHRPEAFELEPYRPPPPPRVRREPRQGLGLLTVRVLRPPVPLEVMVAGERADRPVRTGEVAEEAATYDAATPAEIARWRLLSVQPTGPAPEGERRPKLGGQVRVAAGPWRMEEGWWQEQATERDYWDVELAPGGVLVRVFRERESGEWYADGIYD